MSGSTENDTLCERCSLLSFDDSAIGGQEVVGKDGVARLHFPESQIETRPSPIEIPRAIYQLIRLDWEVEDILPDMPRLSHSSELGCVFCQALLRSLEEALAEKAKIYTICHGRLDLVAYLSLADEGVEGLLVEATFNHEGLWEERRVISTLFLLRQTLVSCII